MGDDQEPDLGQSTPGFMARAPPDPDPDPEFGHPGAGNSINGYSIIAHKALTTKIEK